MRERIAIWGDNRASRFNAKAAETLSATRAITFEEIETYQGFAFDPGGAARDVTLPAEAECEDVAFWLANTADNAEIITVKNDGGDAIVTPTQSEAAFIWCDGTAWYGMVGAFA